MSKKEKRAFLLIVSALVLLLFGAIAASILLLSAGSESGPSVSLRSPEPPDAPGAVTAEDLEKEYESRPPVTKEAQEDIDEMVMRLAPQGRFKELDAFLAQQESGYKNAEGDEAQAMEDHRGKCALLRADIAMTISMDETNAELTWPSYTDPVILASAIAHTPISLKKAAYLDWSSVLFPAVPEGDAIDLEVVDLEGPGEMLAKIVQDSSTRYYGLTACDMTLFGYRCRLYMVSDMYGYYRPYSLVGIDGHLIDPITIDRVMAIERALPPSSTIDDVISVAPFSQEEFDAVQRAHPEWFDAEGNYRPELAQAPADPAGTAPEGTADQA